jgi:hypothetical protein
MTTDHVTTDTTPGVSVAAIDLPVATWWMPQATLLSFPASVNSTITHVNNDISASVMGSMDPVDCFTYLSPGIQGASVLYLHGIHAAMNP